jgi:divalent metal cation (Fe/Co/Zn/Cd) transporter
MDAATRSGVRVSAVSAAWTLLAAGVSIGLGIADGSLALLAFGAVQAFDVVSSAVLVVHLRRGPAAAHLEAVVFRVVSVGLVAVGTTTLVVGSLRLATGAHGDDSTGSLAFAAVSCAVLFALAARKRVVADRIASPGLRADGNLTAVESALAAVTVAGIVAARSLGWWWADPVAASVLACCAVLLGVQTAQASSSPESTVTA